MSKAYRWFWVCVLSRTSSPPPYCLERASDRFPHQFTCSDGLSPQWLSPATVTYLMPLYPTRLCVSLSGSSLPAPAPKPSSGKSQAVTRNSASVPTIVETTVLLREIRCRGHRDGRVRVHFASRNDVTSYRLNRTSQPPKTPRQRLFLDNAADKASPPSALVIAAEVLKVFRPDPNYAALKLECTPR